MELALFRSVLNKQDATGASLRKKTQIPEEKGEVLLTTSQAVKREHLYQKSVCLAV